jgi:hypothetical protein
VRPTDPGWHPDPTGRFEQRFYDGRRWTRRVRVAQAEAIDTISVPAHLQPDGGSDRPEPGWRPDPDHPGRERYHDGWQLTIKSRAAGPGSGRRSRRFPLPRILVYGTVVGVIVVVAAVVAAVAIA